MKQHEAPLRRRADHGRHWWELRSCRYYEQLSGPKIIYQEIQFHSRFAFEDQGYYLNNLVHFLPSGDRGLLGPLNSSLLWWYCWYAAPHKKDEAFALHGFFMETLPIVAAPTEPADQLITLAREQHAAEDEFLGWLRNEFGIVKPTQKLQSYWTLGDSECFAEIKKSKVKLTPAASKRVGEELERSRTTLLHLVGESRRLERELHALVFKLYGLTESEIALVRSTAPPRDPLARIEAATAGSSDPDVADG